MFNKFIYKNKFVIEKHIKFAIHAHKIYWTVIVKKKNNARLHVTHKNYWTIINKKQGKAAYIKNLIYIHSICIATQAMFFYSVLRMLHVKSIASTLFYRWYR